MPFIDKLISSEGGETRVITATEDGEDAWFVLKITPEKYAEYKTMLRSGSGDISDYGDIIESGWGKLSEADITVLKSQYQATKIED